MHTFLQMTHKKLKCEIRKYSLATEKKRGGGTKGKQNKTKRGTQRHGPLSVRWHVVKTLCSQMKCHCWRQRVSTGPSIDSNEMMDAHALFMFECADKSRLNTGSPLFFFFLFLFFRRGSRKREREKKPSARLNITQRVDHCSQGVFVQVKSNLCVLFFFFFWVLSALLLLHTGRSQSRVIAHGPVLSCPVLSCPARRAPNL